MILSDGARVILDGWKMTSDINFYFIKGVLKHFKLINDQHTLPKLINNNQPFYPNPNSKPTLTVY